MMDELKTLEEFVEEHKITLSAELKEKNGSWVEGQDSTPCDVWAVTLRRGFEDYCMKITFRMGIGHRDAKRNPKPPTVMDVLSSCISDSDVDGRDIGEWADDLGYNYAEHAAEIERVENMYNACTEQTEKFREFLGGSAVLDDARFNVEGY